MLDNPKSVIRIDFVTGAGVLESLAEMKEKANLFNVAFIVSTIDGIDIYVSRNCNVSESFKTFHTAKEDGKKFIVC